MLRCTLTHVWRWVSQGSGGFARADAETLAQRRIVVAQKPAAKRAQFAKHIHALNQSFRDWLKAQVAADPTSDLTAGFQVI